MFNINWLQTKPTSLDNCKTPKELALLLMREKMTDTLIASANNAPALRAYHLKLVRSAYDKSALDIVESDNVFERYKLYARQLLDVQNIRVVFDDNFCIKNIIIYSQDLLLEAETTEIEYKLDLWLTENIYSKMFPNYSGRNWQSDQDYSDYYPFGHAFEWVSPTQTYNWIVGEVIGEESNVLAVFQDEALAKQYYQELQNRSRGTMLFRAFCQKIRVINRTLREKLGK
jgi:hypothetical protein